MNSLSDYRINRRWTLFLDRDGVINRHRLDDYVKIWDEFEFVPGAVEAIQLLSARFFKTIVITNQRGIGRELMTEDDLADIHGRMSRVVRQAGGHIDHIYYCPFLADDARSRRKPSPLMGQQAKEDFPGINLSQSIMVGDSVSDMGFGRAIGAVCVRIHPRPEEAVLSDDTDLAYVDLISFAKEFAH